MTAYSVVFATLGIAGLLLFGLDYLMYVRGKEPARAKIVRPHAKRTQPRRGR